MHYDRWHYPLSLAQLAAVLHDEGHEVYIYDADRYFYKDISTKKRSVMIEKQPLYAENVDNLDHYIWKHFKTVLSDFRPELVGVSVFTCKLKSVINTLRIVNDFDPTIKTCIGGAHVTAVQDSFHSESNIDGIFCGYADKTFPKWIREGCPKGVVYGDIKETKVTEIPYVRREALLFKEHYTSRDFSLMMTSRGCIGRCTFCSNSFMWSGRQQFRTLPSIRKEIDELIREWKVDELSLADSSYSDYQSEAKIVADVLKESGLRWSANVRWATLNKEFIEYIINCGCNQISVGLETGSEKMLRITNKACNKSMIREKARILKSVGIKWHLFTIVGFPDETIEDMQETLDFALEIEPTNLSMNSFSPLPGTKMYDMVLDITPELASTVNQLRPNYCFSKHMNLETYYGLFVQFSRVIDEYNEKNVESQRTASADGWTMS
jgi:radical SAM superfamily enzyme YgiQ (UPF0313 family)